MGDGFRHQLSLQRGGSNITDCSARWRTALSIDRLPPQSIEAEQSVLGALLIDRDAVIEVADFLRPEDFYRQANARVYEAILELYERREPVDIVTVSETLERAAPSSSVGGTAYLTCLINLTPTAVNAIHYAPHR